MASVLKAWHGGPLHVVCGAGHKHTHNDARRFSFCRQDLHVVPGYPHEVEGSFASLIGLSECVRGGRFGTVKDQTTLNLARMELKSSGNLGLSLCTSREGLVLRGRGSWTFSAPAAE